MKKLKYIEPSKFKWNLIYFIKQLPFKSGYQLQTKTTYTICSYYDHTFRQSYKKLLNTNIIPPENIMF